MPSVSQGFSFGKKPGIPPKKAPATKRKAIFGDDDSGSDKESGENEAQAIINFDDDLEASKSKGKRSPPAKTRPPSSAPSKLKVSAIFPGEAEHGNLAASHTAAKHAAEAQTLDSSVYDYDGVYDTLHAKPKKGGSSTATTAADDGPQYMQNLLASAEVRKRDQLRAKEKMLAREREAEGDTFAGKEQFVTGAYRAQQEEVRRLEEEERKREEEDAERKRREGGGGMTSLYRGLLKREDERHEAVAKAMQDKVGKGQNIDEERTEDREDESKAEAELAKETGALVNDDGQVVDKRQLLQAGLNVTAKPKPKATAGPQSATAIKPSQSMALLSGRSGARAAMRERQTRMIEDQLLEALKRAAQNEEVEQEAQERAAKSKKTEGEIGSAKERYLQRKREAEAAKAASKSS